MKWEEGEEGFANNSARNTLTATIRHLIFQRKHFGDGYGYLLRQAFVFELDVDIHNELHKHILHDIPKPSEEQLKHAWEVYQANKWLIDQYDIMQATEWLMWACSDSAWRACMKRQLIYLKDNLKEY
jgi:hypothetical protein